MAWRDLSTLDRVVLSASGLAAALLLTIAFLGWRTQKLSREVTESLEAARDRTTVLLDLPKINMSLDRMTTELRKMREGAAR